MTQEDKIFKLECEVEWLRGLVKEAEWSKGWALWAEDSGPSCPWCHIELVKNLDIGYGDPASHLDLCPAFKVNGSLRSKFL